MCRIAALNNLAAHILTHIFTLILAPTNLYKKWHLIFALYTNYELLNFMGKIAWIKIKQIFAMKFFCFCFCFWFLFLAFLPCFSLWQTKNRVDFWARGHKTLPRSLWKLIRMNQCKDISCCHVKPWSLIHFRKMYKEFSEFLCFSFGCAWNTSLQIICIYVWPSMFLLCW